MRTPGFALAACLVVCLSAAPAADTKNGERIVGTWEAVKGAVQPGSTLEFTRDGRLKVTVTVGQRTIKADGTYRVEGDKLTITTRQGGKDTTQHVRIKALADKKLVTQNERGEVDEFKRK
jgi:uncharacterized protein (TIGR03066 family)